MNDQLSAIEQFNSGNPFPDAHQNGIERAWKTARMIDCYSSWKYVAGMLHGAHAFSSMPDAYCSELLWLNEIALLRSLAAHNG